MDDDGNDQEGRMLSLLEKSKLNVSTALSKLSLNDKDVLGVFLIGSRLWGTAHEQSDYDLIVVLKNGNKEGKGKWSIHNTNIDATCFSKEEFSSRLSQHAFLCLVPYLISSPFRWKFAKQMPSLPKLDRKLLYAATEKEARRDWQIAKKKAEKKQMKEAKKVLLHSMRMLRICLQYAEKGGDPKVNIWCVEDLYKRFQNDYSTEWSALEAAYGAEFEDLLGKLSIACEQ